MLFTGGDPYRGGLILLDKDEYQPRIESGRLITSKPVEGLPSAVPGDVIPDLPAKTKGLNR